MPKVFRLLLVIFPKKGEFMLKLSIYVIACFILYHSIPVYAQVFNSYTPQSTYYPRSYYRNNDATDYPVISAMERSSFGRSFNRQNIYLRLNRLENNTLGTTFPNDPLTDRIDRLNKAIISNNSNLNTYNGYNGNGWYGNQYYTPAQSSSKVMNILQNYVFPFMSGLGGMNMNNSYSSYSPEMMQEINRNENLNFGTSVHILP